MLWLSKTDLLNADKMKRKHSTARYPEIEEKFGTGEYSFRAPTDLKKYSCKTTWTTMRFVYDECSQIVPDTFICEKCSKIFRLKLRDCGQTLKRHVQDQCPGEVGINNHFIKKYPPDKRRKISAEDRLIVRDAAVGLVVNDLRPICSVNGDGMMTLLSKMTFVGARYGYLDEARLLEMKLVPSRQTVSFSFFSIY